MIGDMQSPRKRKAGAMPASSSVDPLEVQRLRRAAEAGVMLAISVRITRTRLACASHANRVAGCRAFRHRRLRGARHHGRGGGGGGAAAVAAVRLRRAGEHYACLLFFTCAPALMRQ